MEKHHKILASIGLATSIVLSATGFGFGLYSYLNPIKGIDGINGTNGKDGEDIATWLTGSGKPNSSNGKTGDLYLDTSTGDVYLKNTSGVWEKTILILQNL